ncbi:hypothetical protein BV898_05741 [Hypsibius exemplaris]|uniref:Cilia- and flagella-associated protein 45 n=1 Tax=Hypsibius exemplaris TaxID=2072580 RepID=A0A1W0WYH8_HYPEX|nr:hypothetical protein BV898_05741 [Hypsibius exemplaris]
MPRIITAPLDKKRDLYRVLNRDQCRDLRVIRKNVQTVAELTEGEWRNIRILADTTETQQKEAEQRRQDDERRKLEAGYLQRKAEFDRIEAGQDVDPMEEFVTKEKRENSKQLRAQVDIENLETDDTVRFFNDSLNSALVRAVRDRQVMKRNQIKTLAEQEEFRVDNACRKDTNLGFAIGQKMEEHRHDEDMRYGAMLKDQLRCKEEERMMDKESQAAEGRRALQYARRLQHEEVEDNIKQTEDRRTATQALIAENNRALEGKKAQKLNDIKMDFALAKFRREKIAEEDRQDAVKKEDKRQRELAFAEELSKQKRSTDLKAIEDEKKAQRAVYQSDRDWRLAETTKAIKHMREQEELKKIIEYQRELKLRKNAFEVEAEKKIFDDTQERLVYEAKQAEELKFSKLKQRRDDAVLLRKQIADRERERWEAVQEGWNLGSTTRQDMKARDAKVDTYMKHKMAQAEAAGIPASYLKDVLRHMTNNGYLPKQGSKVQVLQNRDQVRKLIRHFA